MTTNLINSSNGDIVIAPAGYSELKTTRHPISNFGLATKGYVDSRSSGLNVFASCRVRANGLSNYSVHPLYFTLTSVSFERLIIDDVVVSVGDRILFCKDYESSKDFGIYNVVEVGGSDSSWVLDRSSDANQTAEMILGMYVIMDEGRKYKGCGFTLTTKGLITINVTELSFSQFTAPGNMELVPAEGADGVEIISGIQGNLVELRSFVGGTGVSVRGTQGNVYFDVVPSGISHSNLGNLNNDDHREYLNIYGRSGGQIIHGGYTIDDSLTIYPSTASSDGALIIEKNKTTLNSNVEIRDNLNIFGNLTANNAQFGGLTVDIINLFSATFQGDVQFLGTKNTFVSDIHVSGKSTVDSLIVMNQEDAVNNVTGSVQLAGGLSVAKSIVANRISSGDTRIHSSTPSSSKNSGALTVQGGIGVSGDLYASNINCDTATVGTINSSGANYLDSIITRNLTVGNISCVNFSSNTEMIFTNKAEFTTIRDTISNMDAAVVIASGLGVGDKIFIGSTAYTSTGINSNESFCFTSPQVTVSSLLSNTISVNTITSSVTILGQTVLSGSVSFTNALGSGNLSCNSINVYNLETNYINSSVELTISGRSISLSGDEIVLNGQAICNDIVSDTITSNSIVCGDVTYSSGISTGTSFAINSRSLTISGNTVISGNLQVASQGHFVGISSETASINNISSTNGLSINSGSGEITSSSKITMTNTLDSTTVDTGSLSTAGGIGIAKNLIVGENARIIGNVTTETVNASLLRCQGIIGSSENAGTLTIIPTDAIKGTVGVIIQGGIESTSANTGSLTVVGGIGVSGNSNISGITISNRIISNCTSILGNINLPGTVSINSLSSSSGVITNLTTTGLISTSMSTSTLACGNYNSDSFLFNGNTITVPKIIITSTEESNSISSGSIVTPGGLGVAKNAIIGGTITTQGVRTSSISTSESLSFFASEFLMNAKITVSGSVICNSITTSSITSINPVVITTPSLVTSNFVCDSITINSGISLPHATISANSAVFTTANVNFIVSNSITTTSLRSATGTITVTSPISSNSGMSCTSLHATNITVDGVSTSSLVVSSINSPSGVISFTSPVTLSSVSANSASIQQLSVLGDTNTVGDSLLGGWTNLDTYDGKGVLRIKNASILPSITPSSGVHIYADTDKIVFSSKDRYKITDGNVITVRLKTAGTLIHTFSSGVISGNGTLILDGLRPTTGDAVLVDNLSGVNTHAYGIYIVTITLSGWQMSRASYANSPRKLARGLIIIITDGVAYGGSSWMHTTNYSLGTDFTFSDVLSFEQMSSASGVVSTASNTSSGVPIFREKIGSELKFNTLNPDNTLITSIDTSGIRINVNVPGIDHNSLSGLSIGDHHPQYVLLGGRIGGQTVYGGPGSDDTLTLSSIGGVSITSTTNILDTLIISSERIIVNPNSLSKSLLVRGSADANLLNIDTSTNTIGIGKAVPDEKLHVGGNAKIDGNLLCMTNVIGDAITITSSGMTSTNNLLINSDKEILVNKDPVTDFGIATKGYVDSRIMGASYYYTSDETFTSSSSTTFRSKLRLVLSNATAGRYRLGITYAWGYSNNKRAFTTQFVLDTTNVLDTHNNTSITGNLEYKEQYCDFIMVTISEGTHTLDLMYKSESKEDVCIIGSTRIEAWKIAT